MCFKVFGLKELNRMRGYHWQLFLNREVRQTSRGEFVCRTTGTLQFNIKAARKLSFEAFCCFVSKRPLLA